MSRNTEQKLHHSLVQAWEEKGVLYIQTELCELGNLKDYLSDKDALAEDTVWNFLVDILMVGIRIDFVDRIHLCYEYLEGGSNSTITILHIHTGTWACS